MLHKQYEVKLQAIEAVFLHFIYVTNRIIILISISHFKSVYISLLNLYNFFQSFKFQ